MSKQIRQSIEFVFLVGPIALFWFIPWYWVVLYYNLYWTYLSYTIYEANKKEKELSLIYCISLPLLFNFFGFLVVILTESKSKKGIEKSTIDDSSYDTLEANQIVVETNKELRERLQKLAINDDNIQSIEVKLDLNKWATYESDVNVIGLEYKGFKYELNGHIKEKRNDAELNQEIKTLNEFYDIIKDKEIDVLDNEFEYHKNGESDYHYIDKVNWIDEPPKDIIEEFDLKYKKGDHNQYDELIDKGELDHVGESLFANEFNNIDQIELNLKVKDNKYNVFWNNHNVGKCVECDVKVEKGKRFCDDCVKMREKTIKSIDKALDRLEKIYPTKTKKDDEPSDSKKTEKSSYQKAIDLEHEQWLDRKARVDFSVSEEEFKVEPIKTLFKLSKELSKEEYLKKAKQIWKEFITSFLKKHYKESDAKFYGKIDQDKDLFFIDLEYIRDDHYRLCPRLRMSNYDYLLEYNTSDTYDLEGIFDGYQIAHIYELDNKPGESRIVFFANSSWNGNYTDEEFEDMGGWYMEGLGEILPVNDDDEDFYKLFYTTFDKNKENTSYEDMANLFFSFDEFCEYLAKCPIYDYKQALEAGALGEDIDFRSFDISKMENSTSNI